ncbi:MAG: 3-isopropylmalate dehydratase small subunit [Myxococcaceae bacterium]
MEKFTTLTAIAAPLPWANVNTDDIYPGPAASPVRAGTSRMLDRGEMGPNAFASYRWNPDRSPKPDFILNRPPFNEARILIARENFGCGSSREMAVWCLLEIGIRCVIAPSFGDIFYNNCFKNGVLPVRLPPEDVERVLTLAAGTPGPRFTVDLETSLVLAPDGSRYPFDVGEYRRQALLQGIDEIAAALARMSTIHAHEQEYYSMRPWLP